MMLFKLIMDSLTARENIALPLTIGRVPAAQIETGVCFNIL